MEKELSFLKCEKCGSGELDTIENFEENIFQVKCKKCGLVLHEGPIFLNNGPSFIDMGEEVEDIPMLTKNQIKKLSTRELFEKYYFGEICDKYFVDEMITRLINRERVIKLLTDGFFIRVNSNGYQIMGNDDHVSTYERIFANHKEMLEKLRWSEKDYVLVRKTLKKIK